MRKRERPCKGWVMWKLILKKCKIKQYNTLARDRQKRQAVIREDIAHRDF